MAKLRAGVLGCGGRGRAHATGYAAAPQVELVGCADPVEENAARLAAAHPTARTYADYRDLLKDLRPDVVSICTWPHLHREMVEASVECGVRAIHCEKPMAPTYGESSAMHRLCEQQGVKLTFCHQRRFAPEFRLARDHIQEGSIGALRRIEGYCPNLYDWGTHWFDMFHFFNSDRPARWVMGQIDVTIRREVFGVPVETAGLSHVGWDDEVTALLFTGRDPKIPRLTPLFSSEGLVAHGSEGQMEITHGAVLLRRFGAPDEKPPIKRTEDDTVLSVLDLLECLETGREPELSSRKALAATELIFATYESSRSRKRVWLPLEIEDSPLLTGLREGIWSPSTAAS